MDTFGKNQMFEHTLLMCYCETKTSAGDISDNRWLSSSRHSAGAVQRNFEAMRSLQIPPPWLARKLPLQHSRAGVYV